MAEANSSEAVGAAKKAMSEFSRRELREAFSKCDPNETGVVPVKNLKTVLRSLGFEPRNDEIQALVAKIAETKEQRKETPDTVTFEELSELLSEKLDERNSVNEMRAAFELFDSESKGFITIEDLRKVAKELGENIPDDQLREMITEADTRGSGNVCEADFCAIMKKTSLY
ncbi:unnamed protein product [Gongylonema pulchrum]|uniref:Centrin n=1 Tax=Gongylonema pulchrum TaxID=637853 RepID=A0A183DNH5_9BILA|nr:unnamed protein product [Gongylonema pulchrum]